LALEACIAANDFLGALELNEGLAEEMPFARLVEHWFVTKIEGAWGVHGNEARKAWSDARANADPGLERVAREAVELWAADRAALAGKDRLVALSARLEAAKPKAKAEPPKEEPAETRKAAPLAKAKAWPEPPLPPPEATGLDRLTYPRGLLGHVTQYIIDTAGLPDRTMALAGALSACAKALDRKVIGPTGNSTVLFNLLIAETGTGKQHIINCIRVLLRGIGMEAAIAASGIASVQSIEEVLEGKKGEDGKPSALVVIDEYGSFLSRISSKGQGGNVAEIPSILQTLWGWPPEMEWIGSIKVHKDQVKVYGPAFSIFGSSTERAFFVALKKKEVASGFVNRHLLFNAGRGAAERIRPKHNWQQIPGWLAKALKEVAGDPAPIDNRPLPIPNVRGRFFRDFRRIGWGAGAEDAWLKFEGEIRGLPSVDDRELWIRAPEIALRIATVLAVFRGSDVVEVDDLDWAIKLARSSTVQIARGLQKHMLEDYEQADLVEHIREEFRRKTELRLGQIRKYCERKTGDYRKIDAAIHHLAACEEIVELDPPDGPGRPTKRWRWNV
jgi:hypothetical protein